MTNLFDGYRQMTDEDIRLQIALLKSVTFSNTIKEKGQKAVKFLLDTVSDLLGTKDMQVTDIRKIVERAYDDLAAIPRPQLDTILKEELINNCRSLCNYDFTVDKGPESINEDELSVIVIREAAKAYGIDDYLTPLTKADVIYDKYYDHYAKVLQKKLIRLTPEERKHFENRIQNSIIKGDIKRTRELANAMMLSEFNGKTVLATISVPSRLNMLKKVLEVMGVGVFDGINCIIAVAYDSIMTFCRVERSLLAQSVWNVENATGKLSLNYDLMPSYIDEFGDLNNMSSQQKDENSRIIEKERKLLTLAGRENELNVNIKGILEDIKKQEKQLAVKEASYEAELVRLKDSQDNLAVWLEKKESITSDANRVKEEYNTYLENNPDRDNSDVTYRSLKQNYEEAGRNVRNCDLRVNNYENNVYRYSESSNNMQKQITQFEHELMLLRNQLVTLVSEYNKTIVELENEAGYRAGILKKKWDKAFANLVFKKNVYEKVVKKFATREIIYIERMLMEMDLSSARWAFAFEEIRTEDLSNNAGANNTDAKNTVTRYITYVLTIGKKYARIEYSDNEIIDILVRGKN